MRDVPNSHEGCEGDCFARLFEFFQCRYYILVTSFNSELRKQMIFLLVPGPPVGVSVTVFIEFIGDIDEINMV